MSQTTYRAPLYWGLLLIVLGLLFLLNNVDVLDIGDFFSRFWPLILVLIGLKLIFGQRSQSSLSQSGDVLHSNTFGDVKVNMEDRAFQSGQIRTIFGDVSVDASRVKVTGEQSLMLNTVFGDIRLRPPAGTAIRVSAHNLGGEIEVFDLKREGLNQSVTYSSKNYQSAVNKLNVTCQLTFGDIEVR